MAHKVRVKGNMKGKGKKSTVRAKCVWGKPVFGWVPGGGRSVKTVAFFKTEEIRVISLLTICSHAH